MNEFEGLKGLLKLYEIYNYEVQFYFMVIIFLYLYSVLWFVKYFEIYYFICFL